MPRQVRLELEFDGAAYFGWQFQPNRPTVQGQIETALGRLYGARVGVIGVGRTDAGVSALNYVAAFRPPREPDLRSIRAALNRLLPRDIRVTRARFAPASFHARYDARSKLYRYTIVCGRSPLLRARAWEVDYDLDTGKMARAARLFLGRHNFAAFCRLSGRELPADGGLGARFTAAPHAAPGPLPSSLPTGYVNVMLAKVARRRSSITNSALIQVEFEADRFLYKMVRRMVGALFDIGRKRYSTSDLSQAIRDRPLVQFTTAPAPGLLFVKARYR